MSALDARKGDERPVVMCALPRSDALSIDSGPRTGPSGPDFVVSVEIFGIGFSYGDSTGPRNEVSVNARYVDLIATSLPWSARAVLTEGSLVCY